MHINSKIYSLEELSSIKIDIKNGDRVYLYGDLGAGKTTISKYIINSLLGVKSNVASPTYVYYNKYGENIYHFDLYRLESYDEFIAIGGEEILDNPDNICIIEWPELLEDYYRPTMSINIEKLEDENKRKISIDKSV